MRRSFAVVAWVVDPGKFLLGAQRSTSRRWTPEQVRAIAFESAMVGRSGLDHASPEKKYTLRSIPDETFSGLQLMCLMHAGESCLLANAADGTRAT